MRSEIAKFEITYDADLFAVVMYFDRINSPLQIHQGNLDDAVPVNWSSELVSKLENLEKDVKYYVYPNADHNLRPNWDTVVSRDLKFFNSN